MEAKTQHLCWESLQDEIESFFLYLIVSPRITSKIQKIAYWTYRESNQNHKKNPTEMGIRVIKGPSYTINDKAFDCLEADLRCPIQTDFPPEQTPQTLSGF